MTRRQRCAPACSICPTPTPEAMFDHVYAGPHPLLEAERDAYLQYLAEYDEVS